MRSLSLTRNSSAFLIIVVPWAKTAATAKMGISSINLGIISPAMVQLFKPLERTRISATGSPATSR